MAVALCTTVDASLVTRGHAGRLRGEPGSTTIPPLQFERFQFDQGYVQRLVAEDPDTERHFAKYFGTLLALKLRSRLRSPAQIEDARQETFRRVLTTLKQKGGLASAESLGAFVNSVCNNVLFECYRAGARVQPLPENHDQVADHGPDAEHGLMAADERRKVARALSELPDRERLLLRWLFFDERDKDEICRELSVDRNHLRVLVHRAKARFRQRFEEASE